MNQTEQIEVDSSKAFGQRVRNFRLDFQSV